MLVKKKQSKIVEKVGLEILIVPIWLGLWVNGLIHWEWCMLTKTYWMPLANLTKQIYIHFTLQKRYKIGEKEEKKQLILRKKEKEHRLKKTEQKNIICE